MIYIESLYREFNVIARLSTFFLFYLLSKIVKTIRHAVKLLLSISIFFLIIVQNFLLRFSNFKDI